MLELIERDDAAVRRCLQQIADSWQRPRGTVDDVLVRLDRDGMTATVAALRA